MEENGYGLCWIKAGYKSNMGLLKIRRNLEISKNDGRSWNWKEPRNLKSREKEMELEGTYKNDKYSIYQFHLLLSNIDISRLFPIPFLSVYFWDFQVPSNSIFFYLILRFQVPSSSVSFHLFLRFQGSFQFHFLQLIFVISKFPPIPFTSISFWDLNSLLGQFDNFIWKTASALHGSWRREKGVGKEERGTGKADAILSSVIHDSGCLSEIPQILTFLYLEAKIFGTWKIILFSAPECRGGTFTKFFKG